MMPRCPAALTYEAHTERWYRVKKDLKRTMQCLLPLGHRTGHVSVDADGSMYEW